jgi:hypothetical protein
LLGGDFGARVADAIAPETAARNPEDFIKRFSERANQERAGRMDGVRDRGPGSRSTRTRRRPRRFPYLRAWLQAAPEGGWCVAIGLARHESPCGTLCMGKRHQSGTRRIAMCQKAGIEARHRLFDRPKVSCACSARRYAGSASSGCRDTIGNSRSAGAFADRPEADCERSVSFATVLDV